jgi:hypothetical protein
VNDILKQLEKIGGPLNALVSAILMGGTMTLIYLGKVTPEVGFGFIGGSLIPLALGYQANKNHEKAVANAKKLHDDAKLHQVEVSLGVVKQANENHKDILDKVAATKRKA